MHTAIETQGTTMLVYLEGELDHHNAGGVRDKIDEFAAAFQPEHAVLDFGGVSFMDSSGIALILRAQQRMQLLDGSILVCNVPQQARRVLDAAGIGRLVTIR